MTVIVEQGLIYLVDYVVGWEDYPPDTIALGTGTAPEDTGNSSLENEIYRSTINQDANITLRENETNPRKKELLLNIQGGTEVAIDEKITELAVYAGGYEEETSADGTPLVGNELYPNSNTMIYRSTFNPVIVDDGITKNFLAPIQIGRVS